MPQGGRGLHRALRAAPLLLALGSALPAAQAQPGPANTLVVGPGQSATEIALDRVPAGTTFDQFLLALYQRNPQAFLGGDLNRLMARSTLTLPTAEEANRTAPVPAREALQRLRGSAAAPTASGVTGSNSAGMAAATGANSTSAATAAEAPASAGTPASPSAPAAATPTPAVETVGASSAGASQRSVLPWAAGGLALLVVLLLGAYRLGRRSARSPASASARPAPRRTAAEPAPLESEAQGRFTPVLPGQQPTAWSGATRPDATQPSAPPTAPVPKPGLFDLDLNLDSPPGATPPPLDPPRPATAKASPPLGALPDLALGTPKPATARAPGPLDLSGISLDLDPADRHPPRSTP